MKKRIAIAVNLFLGVCITAAYMYIQMLQHHTLYDNGHWESKKATIYKSLVGSKVAMVTNTILKDNALNLGDWHAYQQFTYKKPVSFASTGFRFAPRDAFAFIISYADTLQCGYMFNTDRCNTGYDCSAAFVTINKEGKFTSVDTFTLQYTPGDPLWNQMVIKRNADTLFLYLNNRLTKTKIFRLPNWVKLAFKGSHHRLQVDDFYIIDKAGKVLFKETFSPQPKLTAAVFWPVVLLFVLLLFSEKTPVKVMSVLTYLHFVAALAFIVLTVYIERTGPSYPGNETQVNWRGEKIIRIETNEEVIGRMQRDYPLPVEDSDNKNIIVLGSSQIWGMGATAEQNTVPGRLQQQLREQLHDTTINVINAGMCGMRSFNIYMYYTTHWVKYKPILTIINLSCNDTIPVIFKRELQKFVTYNRANHYNTLLVAEPVDYPEQYIKNNHEIMRQVAEKSNTNYINMQPYMDSLGRTGFLWWDVVHMTDYGYQLFAERLMPEVKKYLEKR